MPTLILDLPDDVTAWLGEQAKTGRSSAEKIASRLLQEAFDRAVLSSDERRALRCFEGEVIGPDGWVAVNTLFQHWQQVNADTSHEAFDRTFDGLVQKALVEGSDASGSAFRLLMAGARVVRGL